MPVRSKRVYDPEEPGDGLRVLVTAYWPRGVSRERAGVYKRALAPSRPLLRAFKDGEIGWPAYEARYLEEMRQPAPREQIAGLATAAAAGTVTVMCICADEQHCHRRLLRELIERASD